jgi:hypothetical protein
MRSPFRFVAAWIAAWCQVVVVAALPLPASTAHARTFALAPICQAHGQKEQPEPALPSHNGHDCALCVVCQTTATATALLVDAPALTPQRTVAVLRFSDAQPRAPPATPIVAAQPRGPPTLT